MEVVIDFEEALEELTLRDFTPDENLFDKQYWIWYPLTLDCFAQLIFTFFLPHATNFVLLTGLSR